MTETVTENVSKARTQQAEKRSRLTRLVTWFDERLGLSHEMLRPAPQYSINPFYWLGALAVVAFVIQGITGIMLALYYVPSPTQAYSSTLYVFQNVSYGSFLQTVHLYTAYAMIMLTFMHLMRGYFVSVHKKPRELMWLVGMAMGFVTLGFGFTGYLLPWTVVSKSATDVGVGMINALPPSVSSFLVFLIVGSGSDAAEVLRFYDLHILVLPAALLILLVLKMYLLETHGVAEPAMTELSSMPMEKKRLIPIFPDVSFYLMELAALFGAAMLVIAAMFPLTLPPQYTPMAAAETIAQPDWYFLWIYQILKIQIFEGPGLPVALVLSSLIFVALIVLPFIDRSQTIQIRRRQKYVTIGAIFAAEVGVLSIWGLLTPGMVISTEQAVLVLGGTALLIAVASAVMYRVLFRGLSKGAPPAPSLTSPSLRSAMLWTSASFVFLLGLGALAIGSCFDSVAGLVSGGVTSGGLESLALSLFGLSIAVVGTIYLLYRLDLGGGSIKRRVKALEVGWKN